jgi:hypothetical protein
MCTQPPNAILRKGAFGVSVHVPSHFGDRCPGSENTFGGFKHARGPQARAGPQANAGASGTHGPEAAARPGTR